MQNEISFWRPESVGLHKLARCADLSEGDDAFLPVNTLPSCSVAPPTLPFQKRPAFSPRLYI